MRTLPKVPEFVGGRQGLIDDLIREGLTEDLVPALSNIFPVRLIFDWTSVITSDLVPIWLH